MDLPELKYPRAASAKSFDEWLEEKYTRSPDQIFDIDFQATDRTTGMAYVTGTTYSEYAIWTWENPKKWLVDRFSLEQIGQAMCAHEHIYVAPTLPRDVRDRAWAALTPLFKELFEPYVHPRLVYGNPRDEQGPEESSVLHDACFMWWDISRYYLNSPDVDESDHQAFLKIAGECLKSSNPAVQESAVHGLGEVIPWGGEYPPAQALLTDFIAANPTANPGLLEYARQARTGQIQ